MAEDFTFNQNRRRLFDSRNLPSDMPAGGGVAGNVRGAGPNDLPPSIRSDRPMTLSPHDSGAPNASAPTRAAIHISNPSPGYTGVSPRVRAELYKAPSAFAQRIRDHAKNK